MHDLDARRMDSVGVAPTPRTERHRFVFSGVAFEVLADPRARFRLPDAYREHVDEERGCVLAEVICSVSGDAGPREATARQSDEDQRALHVSPRRRLHANRSARHACAGVADRTLQVCGGRTRRSKLAQLRRTGAQGMAAAIVQRRGGLNLHAAAIELDGQAVLFLGPSGAGKSTAADLSGAPIFANDRVCVAPDESGRFWVFSLPGGEPVARSPPLRAAPPFRWQVVCACDRRRATRRHRCERSNGADRSISHVRAAASNGDSWPDGWKT